MTEIVGYSEHDFYLAAADFYDAIARINGTLSAADMLQAIKEIRNSFNRDCIFRGGDIRVASTQHLVDWSNGEIAQAAADLPVEAGTFDSCFIGYADLPVLSLINSDPLLPGLATVMRANIWVPDFEHDVTVLMITPITGADISFI